MLKQSWQIEEYSRIPLNPPFSKREEIWIEKRRISLWEYGLFIIGYQWKINKEILDTLKNLCKQKFCLFVQIETLDYDSNLKLPTVFDHPPQKESQNSLSLRGMSREWQGEFQNSYYKKFIPPYTTLIDLTKTEEEILSRMKPKWRYNIRLAEKKWVVVEQVDKHIGNIKKFFELMKETSERNNFSGNTLEYYKIFLKSIEESQLFFAYFEKKIIAAGIFVTSEDTMIYYYGTSSSEYRSIMAPYLLQWRVIEHAKKRKLKLYDFLWVAWPDEKNSSLAGVTDFKMKLSEDRRFVSESYIWVNKKWKYRIIKLLKKLKNSA
jgi:lipid II:glycine glycyltransferase (peptidoglycan interpeptide bridge formation enzyme)